MAMVKFPQPVVAPDVVGLEVENVTFHKIARGIVQDEVEVEVEVAGKKEKRMKPVPRLDKDGSTIPLPPDLMARVLVRLLAEDGRDYPGPGVIAELCYFADRGTGSGGLADAVVVNPKPASYLDLAIVKRSVAQPAVYDDVQAAYRQGATDEEGRANVAAWLLATGRLPQ